MKVVLIDDERIALNYLEHRIQEVSSVNIIGKFLEPHAALEFILHHEADVVFLDICLPEMNGIELAERLLQIKPKLHVVFCTAYEEYAIKAFELNALDYLLKPVTKERLILTLQRIQERLGIDSEGFPAAPVIQMKLFQQVVIESEGRSAAPLRWRTTKAQELFLYFLQNRGQLVRKSAIIELLWPEYEFDKAYSLLYTTVYHIRKTLGPFQHHFQLSNATDGYVLHIENVQLDVEEWESRILSCLPVAENTISDMEQAMGLYTGDYLEEYDYWWGESERFRLRQLWLRTMFHMADWYASHGRMEKVIEKYEEICARHPQSEEAHFALMKAYAATQNRVSVDRQYRLLTRALKEELNELPHSYINDWYDQWKKENKE